MKPLKPDQLGFFNAAYADIPIRDQRDTMERPFVLQPGKETEKDAH